MSAIDAASLKSWESFADMGAWLVIIGVAGEGLEILLKILKHKLKNKCFRVWYNKHEFCIEIWAAVFWIMVVAGLAMEFRGSHKAKTITDRENVRLTQIAATLNLKAENFRLKAAELESKMQPRTITEQQRQIFKKNLANAPKNPTWVVCLNPSSSECEGFASKIRLLLDDANFSISNRPPPFSQLTQIPGANGIVNTLTAFHPFPEYAKIGMLINSDSFKNWDMPPNAIALYNAFNEIGLKPVWVPTWDCAVGQTAILVGTKEGF